MSGKNIKKKAGFKTGFLKILICCFSILICFGSLFVPFKNFNKYSLNSIASAETSSLNISADCINISSLFSTSWPGGKYVLQLDDLYSKINNYNSSLGYNFYALSFIICYQY